MLAEGGGWPEGSRKPGCGACVLSTGMPVGAQRLRMHAPTCLLVGGCVCSRAGDCGCMCVCACVCLCVQVCASVCVCVHVHVLCAHVWAMCMHRQDVGCQPAARLLSSLPPSRPVINWPACWLCHLSGVLSAGHASLSSTGLLAGHATCRPCCLLAHKPQPYLHQVLRKLTRVTASLQPHLVLTNQIACQLTATSSPYGSRRTPSTITHWQAKQL